MLTFEKGRITGNSLGGLITAEWVHCVNCIKDITNEVKVTIRGDTYCSKCAAEYYDKGGV